MREEGGCVRAHIEGICLSLGTQGRLPGRGDFEGREEFRYFVRQGGDEELVLQAKGPNSICKGMETWNSIIHLVAIFKNSFHSIDGVIAVYISEIPLLEWLSELIFKPHQKIIVDTL